MELSINAHKSQEPLIQEPWNQKDKHTKFKRGKFAPRNKGNQVMIVTSMPIKLSGKSAKKNEEVVSPTQQVKSTRTTVEERQNNVNPFPNSDVSNMFDHLLEII